MHHVAIMKKSWGLIPKILTGEKTIESRWYQTKRAPWNKIKIGDTIFFKNSGAPIIAKAKVSQVHQFEIKSINDINKIIQRYGQHICLVNANPKTWAELPQYCVLMFLKSARAIQPFEINKHGFGLATAWICINVISKIIQH